MIRLPVRREIVAGGVASDVDLAQHDPKQGERDERDGSYPEKKTDGENGVGHWALPRPPRAMRSPVGRSDIVAQSGHALSIASRRRRREKTGGSGPASPAVI